MARSKKKQSVKCGTISGNQTDMKTMTGGGSFNVEFRIPVNLVELLNTVKEEQPMQCTGKLKFPTDVDVALSISRKVNVISLLVDNLTRLPMVQCENKWTCELNSVREVPMNAENEPTGSVENEGKATRLRKKTMKKEKVNRRDTRLCNKVTETTDANPANGLESTTSTSIVNSTCQQRKGRSNPTQSSGLQEDSIVDEGQLRPRSKRSRSDCTDVDSNDGETAIKSPLMVDDEHDERPMTPTRGTRRQRKGKETPIDVLDQLSADDGADDTIIEELWSKNQAVHIAEGHSEVTDAGGVTGSVTVHLKCIICGDQSGARDSFLRHLVLVHGLQPSGYLSILGAGSPEKRLERIEAAKVKHERSRALRRKGADKEKYRCPQCGLLYSARNSLKRHVREAHGDHEDFSQILKALEDQFFQSYTRFKSQAEQRAPLRCPFCETERTGRAILSHMDMCHSDEPDFSARMDATRDLYRQTKKETLSYRKKVYEKQKRAKGVMYPCRRCDKVYSSREARNSHENHRCLENPERRKLHQCHVCGFATAEADVFKTHCSSHTDSDLNVCSLCDKGYKTRAGLLLHRRRKHHVFNVRPIVSQVCKMCDKNFYDSDHLKKHMATHSDERPFQCEICGRRYKTDQAVRKHRQMIHLNKYKYHCERCGHGVEKQKYLASHKCERVRRNRQGEAPAGPEEDPDAEGGDPTPAGAGGGTGGGLAHPSPPITASVGVTPEGGFSGEKWVIGVSSAVEAPPGDRGAVEYATPEGVVMGREVAQVAGCAGGGVSVQVPISRLSLHNGEIVYKIHDVFPTAAPSLQHPHAQPQHTHHTQHHHQQHEAVMSIPSAAPESSERPLPYVPHNDTSGSGRSHEAFLAGHASGLQHTYLEPAITDMPHQPPPSELGTPSLNRAEFVQLTSVPLPSHLTGGQNQVLQPDGQHFNLQLHNEELLYQPEQPRPMSQSVVSTNALLVRSPPQGNNSTALAASSSHATSISYCNALVMSVASLTSHRSYLSQETLSSLGGATGDYPGHGEGGSPLLGMAGPHSVVSEQDAPMPIQEEIVTTRLADEHVPYSTQDGVAAASSQVDRLIATTTRLSPATTAANDFRSPGGGLPEGFAAQWVSVGGATGTGTGRSDLRHGNVGVRSSLLHQPGSRYSALASMLTPVKGVEEVGLGASSTPLHVSLPSSLARWSAVGTTSALALTTSAGSLFRLVSQTCPSPVQLSGVTLPATPSPLTTPTPTILCPGPIVTATPQPTLTPLTTVPLPPLRTPAPLARSVLTTTHPAYLPTSAALTLSSLLSSAQVSMATRTTSSVLPLATVVTGAPTPGDPPVSQG